jgi:hypothetical protein
MIIDSRHPLGGNVLVVKDDRMVGRIVEINTETREATRILKGWRVGTPSEPTVSIEGKQEVLIDDLFLIVKDATELTHLLHQMGINVCYAKDFTDARSKLGIDDVWDI